LETSTKENEEMLETIKKLRKELKNIRNAGADNKQELNQLQKSNEILQKKYDDLTAEFSAYKVIISF
jgi:acyl carrier protein phosphodiesterase